MDKMEKYAVDLLPQTARQGPRKQGILPAQEIRELIKNGKIRSSAEISDNQIQPASIDLRLGDRAYRVRASFLPSGKSLIGPKIRELALEEIDLTQPALLRPENVYIARATEFLALPPDIEGKANPKSTTGRLDIFTRLLTEGQEIFEAVPKGYRGDLYVEIFPRTFPIIVKAGTKLNQLRFLRGESQCDDEQLRKLDQKRPLVYENGGDPNKAVTRQGLRISIDLGAGGESIVAYKAKRTEVPIDLAKVAAYNVEQFWEPFHAHDLNASLVLDPGEFYLLASKERVSVPPEYAAEMVSYDDAIGEFTVHYAGFFDPGFGHGASGEIKGTNAVLEVRAHEVPILLEDGREIGRLLYHKMADKPDKVYGSEIGSSYQQQGLALSKQFKKTSETESTTELQTSATQN
jgi:dCTP deaminase